MSLLEKITDLLEGSGVVYQVFKHPPVFTSLEAAAVRKDVSLHQGAKAMVLKIQNAKIKRQNEGRSSSTDYKLPAIDYLMCVLPGDRKIDFRSLRKILGSSDVTLASPDQVEKIVGVKIGAVSPFGHLSGLRILLDDSMTDNETIVFNAGDHGVSIRMKLADYLRLAKPERFSFTKGL